MSHHTEAELSAAQERWDLGPWENGYRQILTPGSAPFQASVVAHVFGGDLWRARLVRAAPELLSALSELQRVYERGDFDTEFKPALDRGRAAIAKATRGVA